ncbi:MAG TPA: FtsW/RodA/SpoVE family cell cycle protein [Verrucomicrobiae bacterium]|nr:FtsW/RodA/SpoVE family cell cycle protein [Verrucomicrobiae bacterium]
MGRFIEFFQRVDWMLLAAAATLTSIGLVAIYGIGISQDPSDLFLFQKQSVTAVVGAIVILGLMFLDYRHLRAYGFFLYAAGALLLLGVLVFGVEVNGTRGWFRLGVLSFQPVELAKIFLTAYLAALYAKRGRGKLTWVTFGMGGVATLIYALLVLGQPDFGSAVVLLLIWGAISAFAGLPKRAWVILPLIALVAGGLLWTVGLQPYQRDRIQTFLDPNRDPRGAGYNAIQARIAIGSGGLFGKGIGEGSQARLRFLPAAATDFIFAVIGEEMGLVGVCFIFGVFLILLVRFVRLGYESEDDFAAYLLTGLAAILLIHLFVNAGMNLGMLPITGIPMPFLSAAASYLLVVFICIGLAQSVAVRRRGTVAKDAGVMLFE